jgi:hypothetical protein
MTTLLLLLAVTLPAQSRTRRPPPQEPQQSASEDPRANRRLPQRKGDITFDDIKFDIEPDGKFERSMLTEKIEALHKQPIKIRGFILPSSVMQQRNIQRFVLVRDNQECCFGPGAALYDCIIVEMQGDARAQFTTRPVTVSGKFQIKEFKYPGEDTHYAIYAMEAKEVQ